MTKTVSFLLRVCAIASIALAPPLSAKVVEQEEDSFVTRDAATVKAAPYEVWAALIAPAKWWSDTHSWSGDAENMYISAQAGGCFCELMPLAKGAPEGVRRGSAEHMTVLLVDPPKALRMRGGLGPLQSEPVDGVLTITLSPSGTGTAIVFEYAVGGYMRFKADEISKAVDGVMSQQLAGLVKLLGPMEGAGAREKPKQTGGAAPKDVNPGTAGKKPETVNDAFEDLDE